MSRATKIWLLVAAGYVVLMGALFWRVFLRGQMAGWDSIEEYWPDLIFQSDAYTSGSLPLWNPYTLGGYAFYADPQASQLAPVNLLCVLLSPLVGTGPQLMTLKIILLFYAAAMGMHVLVHGWTKCHAGAAVAAVTFLVGGPTLVHKNGALLWPMLYLPWALVAFDAYLARPSLRRGALVGFALGAMGAAGHPQGFQYALLILLAYVGYRAVGGARVLRTTRVIGSYVRAIAPGLVLAAIIAGLYWWAVYGPAASIVEQSDRSQRTLGWVLANPLDPSALRELVVANLDTNWQLDLYMGPLALVLLAWRAGFSWSGRLWFAIALLATVLALGTHGKLLPLLVEHVPGFGLFRIPYRYKLITGFACAMGAGLAVAHAMTVVTRNERIVLAVLSVIWTVIALDLGGLTPGVVLGVLILGAVGAMLLDRPRRLLYAGVLVLLVAVDLVRAGDQKLAILQPTPPTERGVAAVEKLPDVASDYRYWVQGRASSAPGAVPFAVAYRTHTRELSGFEQPLTPSRAIELDRAVDRLPALAAHFNTKYVMTYGASFSELPDVAPVLRVYPRADLVPEKDHLARLSTVTPSTLAAVLVDPSSAPPGLPSSSFAPVSGRILGRTQTSLSLEVTVPERGIAVINEAFAPGWSATVDGAATPLFRANHMLSALVVLAGHHRIEFTFSAPGYTLVLALLAALLLAAVGLSIARVRFWDGVSAYIAARENASGDRVITTSDQA